jgi:hypothetical protein
MTTEKQKVLGLDAVEQIKTYVCFACENTKRDVILIMDNKHKELKSELKSYIDNEINERAVLKDENGDVVNYTLKSNNDANLGNHWELNKFGNGYLSNNHIGWEKNGSGFIGKKLFYDKDAYEDIPDPTYDNTIYWDENGNISFGKNVRPWENDLLQLEEKIMAIIKQYHSGGAPIEQVYIKLNNSNTKLNVHKLAPSEPSQYRYIVLDDYSTNVNIDRIK